MNAEKSFEYLLIRAPSCGLLDKKCVYFRGVGAGRFLDCITELYRRYCAWALGPTWPLVPFCARSLPCFVLRCSPQTICARAVLEDTDVVFVCGADLLKRSFGDNVLIFKRLVDA